MKMRYNIQHQMTENIATSFDCFEWIITQNFDLQHRNYIAVTMTTARVNCPLAKSSYWGHGIWMHIAVVLVSIISILMNLKYISDIIKMFK